MFADQQGNSCLNHDPGGVGPIYDGSIRSNERTPGQDSADTRVYHRSQGGGDVEWLNRMAADAIDFIQDHLIEPIAMDDIARRAYASPFHFQRTFHVLTGVTAAEYIRMRRLTRLPKSWSPTRKVVDVALKYGYESPESWRSVRSTDSHRPMPGHSACR